MALVHLAGVALAARCSRDAPTCAAFTELVGPVANVYVTVVGVVWIVALRMSQCVTCVRMASAAVHLATLGRSALLRISNLAPTTATIGGGASGTQASASAMMVILARIAQLAFANM